MIFSSRRSGADDGYALTSDRMLELAAGRDGYLGVESVRDDAGVGITVSYWRDEESIAGWRADAEHTAARQAGRARWYRDFTVRVALVTRAYGFTGHEVRPVA